MCVETINEIKCVCSVLLKHRGFKEVSNKPVSFYNAGSTINAAHFRHEHNTKLNIGDNGHCQVVGL